MSVLIIDTMLHEHTGQIQLSITADTSQSLCISQHRTEIRDSTERITQSRIQDISGNIRILDLSSLLGVHQNLLMFVVSRSNIYYRQQEKPREIRGFFLFPQRLC